MSSGPATSPTGRHLRARRRRNPAGWSLRTRLVLVLAGIVVAVCAIVGIVTTVASYKFAVHRLDVQLLGATSRTGSAGGGFVRPPSGGYIPQQQQQDGLPEPQPSQSPSQGPLTLRGPFQGPETIATLVLGDAARTHV